MFAAIAASVNITQDRITRSRMAGDPRMCCYSHVYRISVCWNFTGQLKRYKLVHKVLRKIWLKSSSV